MPRVSTKTKNRGGTKVYRCGACKRDDNTILPGDRYYQWEFRYGGPIRRHVECGYPRRSELTNAIYGPLLDSIDSAEREIREAESVQDVVAIVEQVTSEVEELREQYEEAAEPFGGGGPNGEKRDEAEAFYDELESFSPEEEPEDDESDPRVAAEKQWVWDHLPPAYWDERGWSGPDDVPDDPIERGRIMYDLDIDQGSDMEDFVNERVAEAGEQENEALENAKQEAIDLLANCPW